MSLSLADREQYRANGFLGPVELLAKDKVDDVLGQLDQVLEWPGLAPPPSSEESSGRLSALLAERSGPSPVPFIECRHLDSALVYGLCTHTRLLDVARALYGQDLLLWRSTFVEKPPGGVEFAWHQDWGGIYGPNDERYGLDPPLSFTAWIALTAATPENGCLSFIPGVGRVLPAVPASNGPKATLLLDQRTIPTRRALLMPLLPGECVIFSDRAVHASGANLSTQPRRALVVRFTLPAVAVRPHFPGHRCVLVSGRDTVGLNSLVQPPGARVPAGRDRPAMPANNPSASTDVEEEM